MIDWKLEKRKISDLKPNPKNPRRLSKHDAEHLEKSLERFGLIDKPIINPDGLIIGGHQRLSILGKKKGESIDCWVPDRTLSEKEVEELNIRLNRNTGEWDFDILANQWDLNDLLQYGFTEEELSVNIEDLGGPAEDNEVLEPCKDEDAITKLGDVYDLDEHRIICGDSTNADVVNLLIKSFEPLSIEITFTSPPYNLGKSIKLSGNKKKSKEDSAYQDFKDCDPDEWLSLVSTSLINAQKISHYQIYNIQILAGNKVKFIEFLNTFRENFVDIMVWQKHAAPAMAEHVMNSDVEMVLIFSSEKNPSRSIKTSTFGRGSFPNWVQTGTASGNEFSEIHAATMPLEFASHMLTNFCSETVYDPFLGSGTTLLAAEQHGRICYGVEISPAYCDIIVRRWINYRKKMGKDAIVMKNGQLCEDFDGCYS